MNYKDKDEKAHGGRFSDVTTGWSHSFVQGLFVFQVQRNDGERGLPKHTVGQPQNKDYVPLKTKNCVCNSFSGQNLFCPYVWHREL